MRIDLHTHGKLSKKSDFSAAYFTEMVAEAKASRLDALALTEHFNTRNFYDVYESLDRLYPYNGEYYEAEGLRIFPGMEVDIQEVGHILLIGQKEHILAVRKLLEPYTAKNSFIPFADLLDLAEAWPLLKIGAHPFRKSTPLYLHDRSLLARLDAFDLNAKDMYEYGIQPCREQVEQFAASFNKPVTAGSDTHQCLQYGSVFNVLERPCASVAELKELILTQKYHIEVSSELPLRVKASVMLKKLMKRLDKLEAGSVKEMQEI
ncbi:PHP domain-containing protein [Paenibacillus massiliensis]|uniref:PHP domain-containing protein n=1 Tax=Paenibacillus massiliensis TaxID=225917 RepID=UPI00041CD956|nr:PHP domain-containing protein [Paenibacillus massiliensis]